MGEYSNSIVCYFIIVKAHLDVKYVSKGNIDIDIDYIL